MKNGSSYLLLASLATFPCFGGVYLGPDLFYRYFKELTNSRGKSEEVGWLPGFQAGGDYEESWRPYLGGDLRFAEGQTRFEGTLQHHVLKKFIPFTSHTDNTIFNMEGRLGYTLGWGQMSFSPFFAMGFQSWLRKAVDRTTGYDEWYRWNYLALGLRWNWRYNSSWAGGFFISLMRMKMADVQIRGIYSWPIALNLADEWQTEAELPFSWTCGTYGLSWVSYFRYLPIGKSEMQRTSRGEIFVPASVTYTLGNRLECMYTF